MKKNDDNLRNRIINFMKTNGLTAYSWSKKAGISEGTIRSFIAGRTNSLNSRTIIKLAAAANIPVISLLEEQEKYKLNVPVNNSNINKDLLQKSIIIVDKILKKKNIKISDEERAKIYVAWYELRLVSNNENKNEEMLGSLINLIR
jgi:transcriptional regulator with XRE-family HTH domain